MQLLGKRHLKEPVVLLSHSLYGLQGFNSVPQSPSAAEAELAMWQLASRMGSLNMQQAVQPQPPQQSPFATSERDPWGRAADDHNSHLAAASLFAGAGNGSVGADAFALHHCESAPAGLFQDELRQLRKLGLTETLGMVRTRVSPF